MNINEITELNHRTMTAHLARCESELAQLPDAIANWVKWAKADELETLAFALGLEVGRRAAMKETGTAHEFGTPFAADVGAEFWRGNCGGKELRHETARRAI